MCSGAKPLTAVALSGYRMSCQNSVGAGCGGPAPSLCIDCIGPQSLSRTKAQQHKATMSCIRMCLTPSWPLLLATAAGPAGKETLIERPAMHRCTCRSEKSNSQTDLLLNAALNCFMTSSMQRFDWQCSTPVCRWSLAKPQLHLSMVIPHLSEVGGRRHCQHGNN